MAALSETVPGSGDAPKPILNPQDDTQWLQTLLGDVDPSRASDAAKQAFREAKFTEIRKKLESILVKTGVKATITKALAGLQRLAPERRPKNPFIFMQRALDGPLSTDVDALRRKCAEQIRQLTEKNRQIHLLKKEIRRVEQEIKDAEDDSDDPGL